MNIEMIGKLVAKDWQLFRVYLLGYIVAGVLSICLMTVPGKIAFNLGSILLITIIIGVACHMVIWSIVIEKKEYRLSFIMSLPIDAADYAMSKLFGGVILYLLPWSVLLVATAVAIKVSHLPDGLLPLSTIMFCESLAAYTLLTAVAVITQSEAWTIVFLVGQNMLFSVYMMLIADNPGIGPHIQAETAHWTPEVMAVLQGELLFVVVVLVVATLIKTRNKCFL